VESLTGREIVQPAGETVGRQQENAWEGGYKPTRRAVRGKSVRREILLVELLLRHM